MFFALLTPSCHGRMMMHLFHNSTWKTKVANRLNRRTDRTSRNPSFSNPKMRRHTRVTASMVRQYFELFECARPPLQRSCILLALWPLSSFDTTRLCLSLKEYEPNLNSGALMGALPSQSARTYPGFHYLDQRPFCTTCLVSLGCVCNLSLIASLVHPRTLLVRFFRDALKRTSLSCLAKKAASFREYPHHF